MNCVLSCLHELNHVHMDIKPLNICINHKGDFILIDLGSVVCKF
jgi:serine/threonine protein kinase